MPLRDTLQGLLDRVRTPERRVELEAELELPPFPSAATYLWRTFIRLHARRGSSGFGPLRITWPEFDAFMRVTGFRLAPWEIEAIEACDDAFMRSQASDPQSDEDGAR